MSETKPCSNSLHLNFCKYLQSNEKNLKIIQIKRAFHLPAAQIDVQPILLMAALEGDKITAACVTDTIRHACIDSEAMSKNWL